MAASQAQHAVRELGDQLENLGMDVKYAIHPVAGRMPGHMNVLLAESNVSYELLKDMDEINDDFRQTDVAIVIGALFKLDLVWAFADLFNGLMAIPNLIALVLLSPIVFAETRHYFRTRSEPATL